MRLNNKGIASGAMIMIIFLTIAFAMMYEKKHSKLSREEDNSLKKTLNENIKNLSVMVKIPSDNDLSTTEGLKKAYSMYKNGFINECKQDGNIYYIGGINVYDGGSGVFDINGDGVGSCEGFSGKCQGIIPVNCERIYAVSPNIWGYPIVDKYNLK